MFNSCPKRITEYYRSSKTKKDKHLQAFMNEYFPSLAHEEEVEKQKDTAGAVAKGKKKRQRVCGKTLEEASATAKAPSCKKRKEPKPTKEKKPKWLAKAEQEAERRADTNERISAGKAARDARVRRREKPVQEANKGPPVTVTKPKTQTVQKEPLQSRYDTQKSSQRCWSRCCKRNCATQASGSPRRNKGRSGCIHSTR